MKRNVLLSLTFVFAVIGFSPAIASAEENDTSKVTICHRTDSATNPYEKIEVATDSVDGNTGNDNGQGDHFAEHKGPLVTSESEAQKLKDNKQKWGDIIPPAAGHSGLNWTSAGQAIYNNGCKYVKGGQGGGETPGTVTPSSTSSTNNAAPTSTSPLKPQAQTKPQVSSTPSAGVNAGSVDLKSAAVPSAALLGSIASLAYGVVRFRKFGA